MPLLPAAAPGEAQVLVPALLVLLGFVGIVVPVVPGLLLIVAGVLVWAIDLGATTGWVVLSVALVSYVAGLVLQYLIPGRRLRAQGVSTGTLALAALGGIVGFFVIPVIGLPIGFVLVIFAVEQARSRDGTVAWRRTRDAVRAVVTSWGIELVTGFIIAATWLVGVALTR